MTGGIRSRLYSPLPSEERTTDLDSSHFEPVAYANLVRLKKPATELFLRLRSV